MDIVRLATPTDIGRVVRMILALREDVSGAQEVDVAHTGDQVLRLIRSDDAVVWVSPGGFIAGEVLRTIINPAPVAVEHGWFASDRSGLRLLRMFEAWAAEKGCAAIRMSTAYCPGAAGDVLTRRGYRATEMAWVR